jgi:hypothetical protein
MVGPDRTAARPGGKPRPDEANTSTTPQHQEMTDTVPASQPPDPPYHEMKLPHEQDESAVGEASAGRDPTRTRTPLEQAHADVTSGQQDTDCYDAVAPRYDDKEEGGDRAEQGAKDRSSTR